MLADAVAIIGTMVRKLVYFLQGRLISILGFGVRVSWGMYYRLWLMLTT
jgi:hypothetical protein